MEYSTSTHVSPFILSLQGAQTENTSEAHVLALSPATALGSRLHSRSSQGAGQRSRGEAIGVPSRKGIRRSSGSPAPATLYSVANFPSLLWPSQLVRSTWTDKLGRVKVGAVGASCRPPSHR